jgi:hypothetical protein
MKLITVQYPDSVDIEVLPKGTVVTISDGTNNLSDGTVILLTDAQDAEPTVHTHNVGPPV